MITSKSLLPAIRFIQVGVSQFDAMQYAEWLKKDYQQRRNALPQHWVDMAAYSYTSALFASRITAAPL